MGCTINNCAKGTDEKCVGEIKSYKLDGGRWVPLEFENYCDAAVEKIRKMGWKLTVMSANNNDCI